MLELWRMGVGGSGWGGQLHWGVGVGRGGDY